MLWIQQLQSAHWGQACGLGLGAYLLGCFTTGFYLVRWRTGQDIRTLGSGNAGARNVGRLLGWPAFLLTLAGDFLKGSLAVGAARVLTDEPQLLQIALLAVVAGHIWPFQLRFHGGKGVATALGALVLYDFLLALAFAVVFAIAWALCRKTMLPALLAFASLPLLGLVVEPGHEPATALSLGLLAVLVLFAHRRNLLDEISAFAQRRQLRTKHDSSQL
jgi:glycerol-3-phosphate acyltransferase PlsY